MPRKLTLSELIAQALTARNVGAVPVDPYATAREGYTLATDPIPALQPALNTLGRVPGIGPALQMGAELVAPTYADVLTAGMNRVGKLLTGGGETLADLAKLTTYHGTPHPFSPTPDNPLGAFDASKIGTGEGAQAFGHGTYLAETPGVARSYTTMHADMNVPGPLYTVDLPDELVGQMLDWDKPLRLQPDAVKQALAKVALPQKTVDTMSREELIDTLQYVDPNGAWTDEASLLEFGAVPTLDELRQSAHNMDIDDYLSLRLTEDTNATGQAIYKLLTARAGGGQVAYSAEGQKVASDVLRAAGIPGIKYLDRPSRGATSNQTRNFVVFPGEERRLTILKRE